MSQRVLVLGGGIGGMTVAHELSRRGYTVEVLERDTQGGGKSRSIPVPGSGSGGRADLPGEHGFRFFPGFYQHLPDSMELIPFGPRGNCAQNLVETANVMLTQFGADPLILPARFPRGPLELLDALKALLGDRLGLLPGEAEFFGLRLWQVMTSCRDRRLAELEKLSWWDYVEADRHSPAYQSTLAQGLSRSLVAARAKEASARTIGQVQVHLFSDILTPGGATDRVLCGPTSEVFLEPWRAEIQRLGGSYRTGLEATGFELQGNRIQGVRVSSGGAENVLTADWYVSALPIEVMASLVTPELAALDAGLARLLELGKDTRWMNGIQFFLDRDLRMNPGHTLHVDSPWALTSISQPQFWKDIDLSARGDGNVRGILSVDISDWSTPGLNGKTAAQCESRQEIADEVWAQLRRGFAHTPYGLIPNEARLSWFLDPAIRLGPENPDGQASNAEPLFINRPNTWSQRPGPDTALENLFLASDYVQTESDLACMESACEAGKRAVNEILALSGYRQAGCRIHSMEMPDELRLFRSIDQVRFNRGLPWDFQLGD